MELKRINWSKSLSTTYLLRVTTMSSPTETDSEIIRETFDDARLDVTKEKVSKRTRMFMTECWMA